jgi:outer membrane protein OmpA-like peptidoglycan-associated protein
MKIITLFSALLTLHCVIAQQSICPSVEGSVEHPLLQPYANSCIVGYNETTFDAVTIPISPVGSDGAEKEITVEGKVIDLLYGIENSENISILEIQRNYEAALKNSGLKIMFSAYGKKKVANYSSVPAKYPMIGNATYLRSLQFLKHADFRLAFNFLGRNQENELAYFVAQGTKNEIDYTLVLYINYSKSNSKLTKDKTFIHAKIIESASMATGQVSSASLEESIQEQGKEIFHNILFDFGSSTLTESSYETIETLADYLKQNSSQKFYIVGHTDNVGGLAGNQVLSEKRAKSVREALINKYGVSAAQISAHGVGQLSPISTNTSEEGRALNRRVEVVLE